MLYPFLIDLGRREHVTYCARCGDSISPHDLVGVTGGVCPRCRR